MIRDYTRLFKLEMALNSQIDGKKTKLYQTWEYLLANGEKRPVDIFDAIPQMDYSSLKIGVSEGALIKNGRLYSANPDFKFRGVNFRTSDTRRNVDLNVNKIVNTLNSVEFIKENYDKIKTFIQKICSDRRFDVDDIRNFRSSIEVISISKESPYDSESNRKIENKFKLSFNEDTQEFVCTKYNSLTSYREVSSGINRFGKWTTISSSWKEDYETEKEITDITKCNSEFRNRFLPIEKFNKELFNLLGLDEETKLVGSLDFTFVFRFYD